jgi:hypothetical protein
MYYALSLVGSWKFNRRECATGTAVKWTEEVRMVLDSVKKLTDGDVKRAEAHWERYQQTHDVADRKGKTVGIDPDTGEVWFGDSIIDVTSARKSKGLTNPLYFVRVGWDHYYRKGGLR